MSFLQPWALWALPLLALPIAIHLIHRRRHRVVAWGAMMFLLQGARMSRGMQRLRHFLLLLFRTLAVAALVLAIGRPLAGGWLGGLSGGRPDVVVVLLDRSASMRARVAGGADSKLAVGRQRLVEALERVEANRYVVVDSVSLSPTPLAAPAELLDLPRAGETDAAADVPALVEVAAKHLRDSGAGRAEVWLLSDLQVPDWAPEDGRWPALQDALLGLPAGVRVNVLAFPAPPAGDLAVRVLRAERVPGAERAELELDLELRAAEPAPEPRTVPVAVVLDGARTVVPVELVGARAELRGHRIPLEAAEGAAWGVVELPADAQPADDRWYFTYGDDRLLETVVVAEEGGVDEVLRVAAEAPANDVHRYAARVVPYDQRAALDLAGAALLLWQGALPEDEAAVEVERFLDDGGLVVLLPPKGASDAEFDGLAWGPPRTLDEALAPTSWRTTGDLLRDGADGKRVPVGALEVTRLHPLSGDVTPLARLEDGSALLARAPTERGGLYLLATTPAPAASNLAGQGVVLVALVQRALEAAAEAQAERARRDAGTLDVAAVRVERVDGADPGWLLSEHGQHAGVVRAGERLVALNRPAAEDTLAMLEPERAQALLPEVDVVLVEGARDGGGLVDEVWRTFLYLVLFALLAEALLCVTEAAPPRPRATSTAGGAGATIAPRPAGEVA